MAPFFMLTVHADQLAKNVIIMRRLLLEEHFDQKLFFFFDKLLIT